MVQQLEAEQEVDNSQAVRHVDARELDYPDTVFVRDIENRVFQAIILQRLSRVEDIRLLEGSFLDNILGKDSVKGVGAEQDSKNQSVNVKVEVSVLYGVSIPAKAEEIQTVIAEDITTLTGLHVSCVHVVFKNVFLDSTDSAAEASQVAEESPTLLSDQLNGGEYDEEF